MSQDDNLESSELAAGSGAEQGTPDTEAPGSDSPPLNRAQRRAQARGKGAPSGPANAGGPASGRSGPSGRPESHAGPVRFPRTGHK